MVGFVRYRRSRISLSAPEETPKLDRSGGYTASSGITFSSSDTAEKLPTVGDDAEIPRDSRKRTIADVQLPEPEVVAEPDVVAEATRLAYAARRPILGDPRLAKVQASARSRNEPAPADDPRHVLHASRQRAQTVLALHALAGNAL